MLPSKSIRFGLTFLLFVFLFFTSNPAYSQEKSWKHEITPYIWLPASIKGTSIISGAETKLDLKISDVFDKFDLFGLSVRAESWKNDQWGLIFDTMYVNLDGKFSGPIPPLDETNVNIRQSVTDLGAGYRVGEMGLGDSETAKLILDVMGGVRINYLRQKIGLVPTTLGGSETWAEPFVGFRVKMPITQKFGLVLRADASGFGVPNASDLTYNVLGGAGYRFNELFEGRLGYRLYDIDYQTGSGQFGSNLTMHGPYMAFTFHL